MTAAAAEALVYVHCDLPSVEPVHTSAPSPGQGQWQLKCPVMARVCCVSPSIPAPDNMTAAAAGH